MTTLQHAKYWFEIFKAIVKVCEGRKKLPREESMMIYCEHCGGTIAVNVAYGDDYLTVEAHCFNDNCQFPNLEGQMTWKEVRDEADEFLNLK